MYCTYTAQNFSSCENMVMSLNFQTYSKWTLYNQVVNPIGPMIHDFCCEILGI